MIPKPELEWLAILPEIITGVTAMLVLLMGMGRGAWSRTVSIALTAAALAVTFAFVLIEFNSVHYGAFGGLVDSDELANTGRLIALVSGFVAVVLGVRGRADDGRHGEFHALLLSAVCGMGLFAASGSFVSLFIGLELFSIALYVLCALDAERSSSLESGLKYLIVGGMSSAVLLYGSALVYGATGSFDFAVIGDADSRGVLLYAGAALVLGGLAFKVSAAPMHWWTPDVYEGAGTPVTAFMSTATKAVAFLVLARVLVTAFGIEADTWVPLVAALAVVSIVVGNAGALGQGKLKRLLAYSSIAQAGYLLTGLVGWDSAGVPALVYALIVYTAMTLGAFAYVVVLERELGRDATLADLAGRGWVGEGRSIAHALPALGLVICTLSLAGIPPTAGFFSKFGLFEGAVESGYAWLAVLGALGSVVSLGYYLRVVVELYMRAPDAARAASAAATTPAQTTGDEAWPAGTRVPGVAVLVVVLAAATLLLAFLPSRVFDLGCDVKGTLIDGGSASCTDVEAAADPPVADTVDLGTQAQLSP